MPENRDQPMECPVSFHRIRPRGAAAAPGARRRLLEVTSAAQAGLDQLTTRTDGKPDTGLLDLGYHSNK